MEEWFDNVRYRGALLSLSLSIAERAHTFVRAISRILRLYEDDDSRLVPIIDYVSRR